MANLDAYPSLERWLRAASSERESWYERLAETLGSPWDYEGGEVLFHCVSELRFVFVPGGSFQPGLSPHEQNIVQQWLEDARSAEAWLRSRRSGARLRAREQLKATSRQYHEPTAWEQEMGAQIDALFGQPTTPLTTSGVEYTLEQEVEAENDTGGCPFDSLAESDTLERILEHLKQNAPFASPQQVRPFLLATVPYMLNDDRQALLDWCERQFLRFPTDTEWEWAARAGTHTIHWSGDEPPSDRDMYECEAWEDPKPNPLGLRGLGWLEELCADNTLRGGAQDCAPWQGTGEFCVMLSAWKEVEDANFGYVRPLAELPIE